VPHAYTHTYAHTYTYTDAYTHTYTHTYTHAYTHSYAHTYDHAYAYVYTHDHTHAYTTVHSHAHATDHSHAYTPIHSHAHAKGALGGCLSDPNRCCVGPSVYGRFGSTGWRQPYPDPPGPHQRRTHRWQRMACLEEPPLAYAPLRAGSRDLAGRRPSRFGLRPMI